MKNIILIAIFLPVILFAQDKSEFKKQVFVDDSSNYLNYRLLYPSNYSSSRNYPLVIFLHGSGERGNDNEAQLIHGSSLFLEKSNREKYPAFIVFPQMAKGSSWANLIDWKGPEIKLLEETSHHMKLLFGLLDMLKENLPIDETRIYLSGLSMGGYGTLDAIMRRPNEFAAALPICGGGDTSKAATISHIPTWIFHGAVDSVVPVELSRNMHKALQEAEGNVKYSEYEGVDHNSWDNAFVEEDYLSWMFRQRKE